MILKEIEKAVCERLVQEDQKRFMEALTPDEGRYKRFSNLKGPRMIAEFKRCSPSKGSLREDVDPVEIAGQYLENGAAAVSVLCEPHFFGGHINHLRAVREAYPDACLLMKDFVIHPKQINQARWAGADIVLLIVALLGEIRLGDLLRQIQEAGLQALVEVHDGAELKMARKAKAKLIGVNNRNLDTMEVSLDISRELAGLLPKRISAVCESGLQSGAEIKELYEQGYKSFLVGSHLMKAGDPGAALARLKEEATCG